MEFCILLPAKARCLTDKDHQSDYHGECCRVDDMSHSGKKACRHCKEKCSDLFCSAGSRSEPYEAECSCDCHSCADISVYCHDDNAYYRRKDCQGHDEALAVFVPEHMHEGKDETYCKR